jgi:hypothetical protein
MDRRTTVKLRFLGKDSTPTNSPTLYATDEDSYVIQGWKVTGPILALLVVPDDETVVEVPPALLDFLSLDGLTSDTRNLVPPIVHVKENGNYIVQGKRVLDAETLSQMSIPSHETCVQVSKSAVALVVGG